MLPAAPNDATRLVLQARDEEESVALGSPVPTDEETENAAVAAFAGEDESTP